MASKVDTVDQEALSTFEQLRKNVLVARSAAQQNRQQQLDVERQLMRSKLLLQQLSDLDNDAVLYKNLGKAYICTPRAQIIERYENNCKELAATLEKLLKNKAAMEKSIESAENEFKELIASNPAVGQRFLEQSQGA